ncbi:MAG: DUF2141 domain-containing protein [Pseudomonadota bacterium]
MRVSRKMLSNVFAVTGLLGVLAASYGPGLINGSKLTVHVTGIRNTDGTIHLLLYDRATAFENASDIGVATYMTRGAKSGDMEFRFARLVPGDYAIFVHHDENASNTYDADATQFEGYGYSRNVGLWDTPSFKAAAISLPNKDGLAAITMIYPE